jgi:Co/Zn/Cd efflux system component
VKSLKSKKVLVITLAIMLLFSCVSFAFAAPNVNPTANPELIKTTATNIAENVVGVVQGVFGVAAVCFVIWAGIMFWGASGDPNKIAMAKKAFAGFIVAMICIFFADKIVGGLLGIFGI